MTFTAARYIIATDTLCAAIGETPEEARESLESAPDDVIALMEGIEPRLALVDLADAPRSWRVVEEFYRVRNVIDANASAIDKAHAYHFGEESDYEADFDEAVRDAESLDDVGNDCEVVAFTSLRDSGRVVWGA